MDDSYFKENKNSLIGSQVVLSKNVKLMYDLTPKKTQPPLYGIITKIVSREICCSGDSCSNRHGCPRDNLSCDIMVRVNGIKGEITVNHTELELLPQETKVEKVKEVRPPILPGAFKKGEKVRAKESITCQSFTLSKREVVEVGKFETCLTKNSFSLDRCGRKACPQGKECSLVVSTFTGRRLNISVDEVEKLDGDTTEDVQSKVTKSKPMDVKSFNLVVGETYVVIETQEIFSPISGSKVVPPGTLAVCSSVSSTSQTSFKLGYPLLNSFAVIPIEKVVPFSEWENYLHYYYRGVSGEKVWSNSIREERQLRTDSINQDTYGIAKVNLDLPVKLDEPSLEELLLKNNIYVYIRNTHSRIIKGTLLQDNDPYTMNENTMSKTTARYTILSGFHKGETVSCFKSNTQPFWSCDKTDFYLDPKTGHEIYWISDKVKNLKERYNSLCAKVKFNKVDDVSRSLATVKWIDINKITEDFKGKYSNKDNINKMKNLKLSTKHQIEKVEGKAMKMNIGTSFLEGMGKDTSGRVAVSMNGLAVKLGESSYASFNGKAMVEEIFIIEKFNQFIFKMPVPVLELGDFFDYDNKVLIAMEKFYFGKPSVKVFDPIDNIQIDLVPRKNVFNMQMFMKFTCPMSQMIAPGAMNPMMLIALAGEDGDLFGGNVDPAGSKDEDDQKDVMKMFALSQLFGGSLGSPQNQGTPNNMGNMQSMLPLMMLSGSGKKDSSGVMQMMLLSSMMGGQMGGAPISKEPVIHNILNKDEKELPYKGPIVDPEYQKYLNWKASTFNPTKVTEQITDLPGSTNI